MTMKDVLPNQCNMNTVSNARTSRIDEADVVPRTCRGLDRSDTQAVEKNIWSNTCNGEVIGDKSQNKMVE